MRLNQGFRPDMLGIIGAAAEAYACCALLGCLMSMLGDGGRD
jgi:hypothetical protein